MDPFNPTGAPQFETFDPYGEYSELTAAAFYDSSCGGGININCGCA